MVASLSFRMIYFDSSIRAHRDREREHDLLDVGFQKVTSSDRMMETICCEKAAAYFLLCHSFSVYTLYCVCHLKLRAYVKSKGFQKQASHPQTDRHI